MSNFEVTRVSATIASATAESVADFPAIPEVDRAFLFPATFPMSSVGIGRTSGSLNNSFRSITATAEITTVDDVTFDDYNDSVLRDNLCAAWLLTYTGAVGGPHEIVNRALIDLTIADGQSTVDSSEIEGIVDADDLVPLVFAAGNHNSADFTTHFPTCEFVDTGGGVYVLRVTRQGTSGTMRIIGRIAEFTGSEWNVQHVPHEFVASDTNEDEVISSADPDHSFTISYMQHTQTNQPVQQMFHVWLEDATTLRHRIRTKPSTSPTVNTWVISNSLLNVTRYGTPDGTSEIAATGSSPETVDITVTAVPDLAQAMVIGYMGCDTALTTTCPAGLRSFEFTSTTNVRARRSDSVGDTEYVLQVIDFSEVIDSRIDSVTEIVDGEDFTITGFFGTNPVVTHGGDAVTVNSDNGTEIACTASLGTKRYGDAYQLKVVDDTGSIATIDVSIAPADGVGYANLYEPLVDASQRITTTPDDLDAAVEEFGSVQLRWRNVTGSGMTKDSFSCPSSGNARFRPEATSVEISVHTDEWGDWGTQTLGPATPVGVLSRVVYDTDTTAPNAPTLTGITILSSSSLRVAWLASSSTDKAGYRVKRSSTSSGTYTQVGSDLSTASLSYDDTGLSASTTYYYRVFAFDAAGNESIASNTGFATTSAVVIPGGLTAPGVSSTIEQDGAVTFSTLSGENFGSAAITCVLHDDFRNQADGATPSTTAVVGTWSSTQGQVDDAQGLISGRSWLNTSTAAKLGKSFTASSGFRGSFWLRSPVSDSGVSGGRSKTFWVMDGPSGFQSNDDFDLAFPTKMGSGSAGWGVAGNDGNLETSIGPHLPANQWVRFSFAFNATNGYRFQSVGATYGLQVRQSATSAYSLFPASTTVSHFDVGSTTDPAYNYTGIMIHTGTGAHASVEVGNSSVYANCTALYDCQITSWSPSEIGVIIRAPQAFLESGSAYFHITLADRVTRLSARLIS